MIERIIIAGAGGQGIMLLGKVLATAAMEEGKHVTWFPSYGAEVRGGTAYCMVIISDKEIGSPYVDKADTLIIMNSPSLEKFKERLDSKGILIVNTSLMEASKGGKINYCGYPFTDMAIKLGNIKVANMIALGCYLKKKGIVRVKSVLAVMQEMAPSGKRDLLSVNTKALNMGIGVSK